MTKLLAAMVAAGVALAGTAAAGEGCHMTKTSAEGKTCTAGEHTASAGKGCCMAGDKTAMAGKSCGSMKAGECGGCDELRASGKALRAAGADIEVVKTKTGYIVIATAADEAGAVTLRRLTAERWSGFRTLAAAANEKNGKKFCASCDGFAHDLTGNGIRMESVSIANGVMTVFTASGAEAAAHLQNSCGAYCGMQTASATSEKPTANN